MYGTLKKIFAFAGSKKGLLKKSLLFAFLSGLFSAMQFAALFVVIGALVSDNRDGKFICISLGIMAVSLIGRIITTYFSTMEQTETGYCMVAEKRIHIGDRLRYIPMGYFNKNSIRPSTPSRPRTSARVSALSRKNSRRYWKTGVSATAGFHSLRSSPRWKP